jgi:hypothetical protein
MTRRHHSKKKVGWVGLEPTTNALKGRLSVCLTRLKTVTCNNEFYLLPSYQFTEYFENEVMRKRPYLTKEMCIRVVQQPARVELQEQNRCRFWGSVEELQGKFLRVVTLSDKVTIHNAFLDRGFKP